MHTGDSGDQRWTYWSLFGFPGDKKRTKKSSHGVQGVWQSVFSSQHKKKQRNHRFLANSMLDTPDSHHCSGKDSGWSVYDDFICMRYAHIYDFVLHIIYIYWCWCIPPSPFFWWGRRLLSKVINARQGHVGWLGACCIKQCVMEERIPRNSS